MSLPVYTLDTDIPGHKFSAAVEQMLKLQW